MSHRYDVSIITVNYNGLKDTCDLINSIPYDEYSLEIVVVDNASNNDEASIISAQFPQVTVVRSNKNLGFAGGNNLGIKVAQGKYLFFINNDTVFPNGTNLRPLIRRLESNDGIGAVCPKIRFEWDNHPIQFAGYTVLSDITIRNRSIGYNEEDKGQYDAPHPIPYAHGAAMMVKREVVEKAGPMPECYFLYYEELDWSLMIQRAGYTIWYEPACTIFHKESRATGINSPLKTFYTTRNRLLFVKRNVKSTIKYISYCYLIGIVYPKDTIKYLLKRRIDLVCAAQKGISDFLKM